jgi:hypothetical protein
MMHQGLLRRRKTGIDLWLLQDISNEVAKAELRNGTYSAAFFLHLHVTTVQSPESWPKTTVVNNNHSLRFLRKVKSASGVHFIFKAANHSMFLLQSLLNRD